MLPITSTTEMIVRTERGLTLAGTRITLYDLLSYLKADWPPHLVRHWLCLTDAQMQGAMDYIAAHCEQVDAEYERVVQRAEANRQYWEERNRDRLAAITQSPPKPGTEAIYARLRARKAAHEHA